MGDEGYSPAGEREKDEGEEEWVEEEGERGDCAGSPRTRGGSEGVKS